MIYDFFKGSSQKLAQAFLGLRRSLPPISHHSHTLLDNQMRIKKLLNIKKLNNLQNSIKVSSMVANFVYDKSQFCIVGKLGSLANLRCG